MRPKKKLKGDHNSPIGYLLTANPTVLNIHLHGVNYARLLYRCTISSIGREYLIPILDIHHTIERVTYDNVTMTQ